MTTTVLTVPLMRRPSLSCLLFGHQVDNRRFAQGREGGAREEPSAHRVEGGALREEPSAHRVGGGAPTLRECLCGASILPEDAAAVTRIRHNVACFLGGHQYVPAAERDAHREYICVTCGHPLLFECGRDPYVGGDGFKKRVRYLCNLLGHRVHRVTDRNERTEYACRCGHSFLKAEKTAEKITHPLVCLFAGHFVRFVERRGRYAEYLCRSCGHTFGFEG